MRAFLIISALVLAPIVVPAAPQIILQPKSKTVPGAAKPILTVSARGQAPLQYQWFMGTTAGVEIFGETRRSTRAEFYSDSTLWQCRVSDGTGWTNTQMVRITQYEQRDQTALPTVEGRKVRFLALTDPSGVRGIYDFIADPPTNGFERYYAISNVRNATASAGRYSYNFRYIDNPKQGLINYETPTGERIARAELNFIGRAGGKYVLTNSLGTQTGRFILR